MIGTFTPKDRSRSDATDQKVVSKKAGQANLKQPAPTATPKTSDATHPQESKVLMVRTPSWCEKENSPYEEPSRNRVRDMRLADAVYAIKKDARENGVSVRKMLEIRCREGDERVVRWLEEIPVATDWGFNRELGRSEFW